MRQLSSLTKSEGETVYAVNTLYISHKVCLTSLTSIVHSKTPYLSHTRTESFISCENERQTRETQHYWWRSTSSFKTISSLLSPASSPHCKLAAAVIAEKVHSEKLWRPPMKKWFRMLWFKAKGPVNNFLQLALGGTMYSAQVDALVMWSRGQRSQSTQSKTRLCTNVFRRQTLGNGYSLFIISLQTKPTFLFKAEISPHSVNWVS